MALQEVTDQNFEEEVLKAGSPVLVDFWAPWCGPCRLVTPVVEEIAKEYEGKLKVVKVNTDDNPQTAVNYHISGIPSLLLFKEGQVADQIVGAVPKARLSNMVSQHV
ncbi:thioredoxin [bacterium (Candidatus Blackallbacteria) CG17_big_fil_post_rev_8_21_14_2_50_48_46]|uniref:Thioredoxin n=1 Tax=bacterium (Candidatus Blackallbacteria) CG17_big_fil_post_rev_8_21_14_2_50_48_46 TaxID=2014261 RepID=A0A2M7FY00_9BACT|nr:MAG: thioredoxin [bacterium (Candidatus Blackallbacteria) CG18_big_fil_WC_8_21_14_2_50_49_26]PIW14191.1 MAG: thioredoxin [bacterium (Candidatus Blackallbacteria) CG17_big_fil_post_rev_8_21_14_2_50_48_46]PIW46732.1 MAG: thioredoxin [bacterium (Candidatus Blackallbacteria) CG13_big_fil_rev_8_21_14_2_50_49_14]